MTDPLSRAEASLLRAVLRQPGMEFRLSTGRMKGAVRLTACATVSELVRRGLVVLVWAYENGDLGLRGTAAAATFFRDA